MFARKLSCAAIALTVTTAALLPSAAAQGDAIGIRKVAPDAMDPDSPIVLGVGEQRVIATTNVKSYSEGTKGVVDVRLTDDAKRFVIVGLAPGNTSLLFIMMDGSERHINIRVTDPTGKQEPKPVGVPARENIRLDFYFVQLMKSYTHQVGIGWPGAVAGSFGASFDLKAGALDSATAVITNQALPRLDVGQSSGWAKVLRQAAVVTANGEKSSFSGGGEVNIAVQGSLTTGVHKISFGSMIQAEPHYDAKSGRIELRLHADVSELESDRGTGVPGRVTSTLDTVVNLELGQSIILAGLTAKTRRASKTGLPGLSQLPLLGVLFGSHAAAEDEAENVVLIVPSVVDAVSMQDRERINEGLRLYDQYTGDLDPVNFVPPAKSGRRTAETGKKP